MGDSEAPDRAKTRVYVRASVGVRLPDGLHFGTLKWVERDVLLLEVDAQAPVGTHAEVRLDLTPHSGTALVEGVCRASPAVAAGEMARLLVGIVKVAADDRKRFEAWLVHSARGGTLSDFSLVSTATDGDLSTMGHADAEAARKALENLDRKLGSASGPRRLPGVATSGGSVTPVGGGPGRDAMRTALRRALVGQSTAAGAPPPRTVPAAPPPAEKRATAGRSGDDPRWSVMRVGSTTFVEVAWTSPVALAFDWFNHLSQGRLELKGFDGGEVSGAVRAVLRHADIVVEATLAPLASGEEATAFRLELVPANAQMLRLVAEGAGRRR
jgi:hypothetical protein